MTICSLCLVLSLLQIKVELICDNILLQYAHRIFDYRDTNLNAKEISYDILVLSKTLLIMIIYCPICRRQNFVGEVATKKLEN